MVSNPSVGFSRHRIRRRLSGWLNRAPPRRSRLHDASSPPEPLPLPSSPPWSAPSPPSSPPLPSPPQSPRRRPITPSDSVPCHQQKQSLLFSRLPPEIRRVILLCAFGNSTLHMALSFDHPMLEHAKTIIVTPHSDLPLRRDVPAPEQRRPEWRIRPEEPSLLRLLWWRIKPDRSWQRCGPGKRRKPVKRRRPVGRGPVERRRSDTDQLISNQSISGHIVRRPRSWLVKGSSVGRVGAMGWLLSCRAAYHEGIDVLFKSNRFHLSGELILRQLTDYILPIRLAQISLVEMVLPLPESGSNAVLYQPRAPFELLLTLLDRFAGIRKLHLRLLHPHVPARPKMVDLLGMLDAMDEFVGASEPVSVVLQTDADVVKRLEVQTCDMDDESTETWHGRRAYQVWRFLDGDATAAKMKMCSYPHVPAPLGDPASSELGRSRGYWIMGVEKEPPCNML